MVARTNTYTIILSISNQISLLNTLILSHSNHKTHKSSKYIHITPLTILYHPKQLPTPINKLKIQIFTIASLCTVGAMASTNTYTILLSIYTSISLINTPILSHSIHTTHKSSHYIQTTTIIIPNNLK